MSFGRRTNLHSAPLLSMGFGLPGFLLRKARERRFGAGRSSSPRLFFSAGTGRADLRSPAGPGTSLYVAEPIL